ncbi:hypothetical protein ABMA27_000482 [Loxostege sticticalis]|uniref:Uncharacterized protein n=1 Tax=Loxostege sticticalis TaxID=481309 RepID=A0ABR3INJ9_LOXSC
MCGTRPARAAYQVAASEASGARAPQIRRGLRTHWTCTQPPRGERNCDLRHPRNDTTMKILPVIMLLACVAWQATARAQDEGEARAAPTRGLLKRGGLTKKPTTTTTTPAPQEEAEYEDEDYAVEEQEPSTEAPPSSTEGKKLVGNGVRPFRSNTDLLETLKRRRAQAAEAKHGHGHSATAAASSVVQSQEAPTEAPVKASFNSKKRFNNAPVRESNNEDVAPAPAKPSRGRFGRPAARSIPEPENEEQNDAAPPTRTGRGFSRRGGY